MIRRWHAKNTKGVLMGSTAVCLVVLLIWSLMGAIGKPPHFPRRANKMLRASRAEEDRRALRKFPRWKSCSVNPWEMTDKYEGDMTVINQTDVIDAISDPNRKWPNREVPYTIDDFYFYDEEVEEIKDAIADFNSFTCVNFRPATEKDEDFVSIIGKQEGCYSDIGRAGGAQELNLEPPACIFKRNCIFHELMHAIGFAHEHTTPMRDFYIRINYENIAKGKEEFFLKMEPEDVPNYGVEYDYSSIMHPSRTAFSVNNTNTIETQDEIAFVGATKKLSPFDIRKVEITYECGDYSWVFPTLPYPRATSKLINKRKRQKGSVRQP